MFFVREAGLKTRNVLPANFTGYMVLTYPQSIIPLKNTTISTSHGIKHLYCVTHQVSVVRQHINHCVGHIVADLHMTQENNYIPSKRIFLTLEALGFELFPNNLLIESLNFEDLSPASLN